MAKKDGNWAFPTHNESMGISTPGMTLKQYYAGQALVGMLARHGIDHNDHFIDQIVKDCNDLAEMMVTYKEE